MRKLHIFMIVVILFTAAEIIDASWSKTTSTTSYPVMKLCGIKFIRVWKIVCKLKNIRDKNKGNIKPGETKHPIVNVNGNHNLNLFIFYLFYYDFERPNTTVKANTLDAFLERTHYYPSYKDVRPPARFTPKEPFICFKNMFALNPCSSWIALAVTVFFSVLSKKAFAFMFEFA